MENTLAVAQTLYDSYLSKFNEPMDEMKMHKLMYFTQRESLICTKEPLFDEKFHGWKYGPVLLSVREEYKRGASFNDSNTGISVDSQKIVKQAFDRYAHMSAWKLSMLSHGELAWKVSRKGFKTGESGNIPLKLSEMRIDALREQTKREAFQLRKVELSQG